MHTHLVIELENVQNDSVITGIFPKTKMLLFSMKNNFYN